MPDAKPLRTHVYVQRPCVYEIAGCECGNYDPDWSEFQGHLWCQRCEKDFIPEFDGVFCGPIIVETAMHLGLCFDRVNLATGEVERFKIESVA